MGVTLIDGGRQIQFENTEGAWPVLVVSDEDGHNAKAYSMDKAEIINLAEALLLAVEAMEKS